MKLIIFLLVLATQSLFALELPSIFSSHMVMQRNLANPVWGWDTPKSKISVTFANQIKTTTTDEHGKWELKLDALKANTKGQTMEIQNNIGQSIVLKDILVGDVWICSGQSNMEWSVKQSKNSQAEIANAQHPIIRLFNVPGHHTGDLPQTELTERTNWKACSPKNIKDFSAVGYYFGRELIEKTNIPVGLIGSNWGGTRIEPWTPLAEQALKENYKNEETRKKWDAYLNQLAKYRKNLEHALTHGLPIPVKPLTPVSNRFSQSAIYNAMISPLVGYGVRGAIWYQGESNASDGIEYLPKIKNLIEGWRAAWNQPSDFPFYFYVVKLAQFKEPHPEAEGGDHFAPIRVAQDRIQELPHTGVASAIDIGAARDIHPRNKQDVGKRLALWALRDVHNRDIVVAGPTFKQLKIEGPLATIHYNHLGSGLMIGNKQGLDPVIETPNRKIEHFAISGADNIWYWANAKIVGDTIQVSSPNVPNPVAVRFAYTSNPNKFNLYNKEGLPAVPFRTDDGENK